MYSAIIYITLQMLNGFSDKQNAFKALVSADYYSFAAQKREGGAVQKSRINLE